MLKEISNLEFGEFTLDRHSRELRRRGSVLPVSGKAFDLLSYMAANAGRPLSKSELLDAVWPEISVEESNLSQNVFLLRKVLGAGGDGPIKTLPGRGYQFAAQVTEIESTAPSGAYTLPIPSDGSSVSLETTHTRMVVEDEVEEHISSGRMPFLIAILMVAVLLAGGLFLSRHPIQRGKTPTGSAATSAAATGRRAVAVIGFRNASSHSEDAWLSTAVAEMLASDVSAGDKLRVIPNEDVQHAQSDLGLKAGAVESEQARSGIRQATGADMLVEGSYVVLDHGTKPGLRLMVQVEDARSGKQLASFSETGEVGGLFTLVDQAGAELRKDLSDNGSEADDAHALSGMSQSADAMRFYAEGIDQARRFDSNSARGLFERAIQADPKFAMAHLGSADAWVDLGFTERAAREADEAYKLSADLPREQRLAIEAEYRGLSHDDEHAINIYKALSVFYPDDPAWGIHLAVIQVRDDQTTDAIASLERLRNLPLTPAQAVEVNGREATDYALLDTVDGQQKARKLASDAVSIATRQNGLLIRGAAFRTQCFVLASIGPIKDAQDVCEQEKTIFESAGNLQAVASAVNNLAGIASERNDWKQAEAEYAEAQHLFHDLGNVNDEYFAVYNLGLTHIQMGELEAAISECGLLRRSHGTNNDGYLTFSGNLYVGTADIYEGKIQEAENMALAAERIAEKEKSNDNSVFQQVMAKSLLASIALTEGELGNAHKMLEEGSALLGSVHHEMSNASHAVAQAELEVEEDHPGSQAIEVLRNAIAVLAKNPEEIDNQMKGEVFLARMDLKTGAFADASHALSKAKALDGKGTWEDTHLEMLLASAELQQALGHPADAKKTLQEEVSEADAKKYAYLEMNGEIALAKLAEKTTPSPENAIRLQALSRQAEHSGFKGLARQATSPRV